MSVLRFVGCGSAIGLGLIVAAMGCSDPAAPIPQGAFAVTFGNAAGTAVTCPAIQDPIVQVGVVSDTTHSAVSDGDGGATVTCKVAKSGAGFSASGSIIKGSSQFYMTAVAVGEGKDNTGAVSISSATTAGRAYGPEDTTGCSFEIISAGEGRIWLSFQCPHVSTGSSESEQCSLQNGYVIFENCDS